jgi:formate hydrogenlyase subunit 3/multisubunit Na+/H+ antiporter MnhD subunit
MRKFKEVVMYRNILKVIVTVSLMSLLIVFGSAVNTYEVKADTEQIQTVQESNNLPSTEEEIENMSLTDKLLLLILIVMCVFLGAFVGYVVMDRLR